MILYEEMIDDMNLINDFNMVCMMNESYILEITTKEGIALIWNSLKKFFKETIPRIIKTFRDNMQKYKKDMEIKNYKNRIEYIERALSKYNKVHISLMLKTPDPNVKKKLLDALEPSRSTIDYINKVTNSSPYNIPSNLINTIENYMLKYEDFSNIGKYHSLETALIKNGEPQELSDEFDLTYFKKMSNNLNENSKLIDKNEALLGMLEQCMAAATRNLDKIEQNKDKIKDEKYLKDFFLGYRAAVSIAIRIISHTISICKIEINNYHEIFIAGERELRKLDHQS